MNKPVIALDCDDVIVGTAPAIVAHYNATYGTSAKLSDYYGLDATVWGTDDATAIERVHKYQLTPEFQDMPPFREAIAAIRQLSAKYEMHVVTGRQDFLAQATSAMLQEHFPNISRISHFKPSYEQPALAGCSVL